MTWPVLPSTVVCMTVAGVAAAAGAGEMGCAAGVQLDGGKGRRTPQALAAGSVEPVFVWGGRIAATRVHKSLNKHANNYGIFNTSLDVLQKSQEQTTIILICY